jgi:hypothetical protein
MSPTCLKAAYQGNEAWFILDDRFSTLRCCRGLLTLPEHPQQWAKSKLTLS